MLKNPRLYAAKAERNFRKVQNIFRMVAVLQLTGHLWPQSHVVPGLRNILSKANGQFLLNLESPKEEDLILVTLVKISSILVPVLDGAIYDYIIVGAGTAGCVVASRLAELENIKILLVEAGGNPPMESMYPAYFPYLKKTYVDWNLTSAPDPLFRYHKGGVASISQGKMLGGTSSLNYMMYSRGNPVDYTLWSTIVNDSSWSHEATLPLFMKHEKMIDRTILKSRPDNIYHGTKGRLKVRKFHHEYSNIYFSIFKELRNNIVVNINPKNPLGFTNTLFTCGKRLRQSSAYSFLTQVRDSPRLHLLKYALVTEIIFDQNKTAVGVKIRTKKHGTITVRAEKEVILTAGAFKTPQLLMLSGIGPAKHLQRKGIKVLADLPVGKDLQDHPIVVSVFKTGIPKQSTRPLNPFMINVPVIEGYVSTNRVKTFPEYAVRSIVLDEPETFLTFCAISLGFTNEICDTLYKGTEGRQIFVVFNHLTYPRSRGEVLLDSTNIKDQPIIKLGFYSQEADLEAHAHFLMQFNAILNTTYFKKVNATFVDPHLRSCRKMTMSNLNYWKCYASSMITTFSDNVGTCAMGTVLDSKLKVKGVKNLRVADASVVPSIVSSPIAATVMMIGEKVAKMIKDSYCKA